MESRLVLPPVPQRRNRAAERIAQEQAVAAMKTTAISAEDSLALVQIFLNAAIASVLYTRELLKHDSPAFTDRCVADLLDEAGPVSYTQILQLNTEAEQGKSQVFKILLKRQSQRADKILTLLEGGIFHALQCGYLEAVQLSVCADSSRPAEVIECYTFTFTYGSTPGQSGRNISSVTVSPSPQNAFIVGDAQMSFNAAIKALLKVIRGLPQLPRHRNLGLNLFYTDACPPSYEPRGFTSCLDDDLYFPGGPMLVRKTTEASRLATGAHRTAVVVSHVDSAEDQALLQIIPEDVDYAIKRSRMGEYKIIGTHTSAHDLAVSSQSLPAASPLPPPDDMMASPAAPSTQTRDDIQTKEALQQMQRSSSRTRGLMPTQSLIAEEDLDDSDDNQPDQSYVNAPQEELQVTDLRPYMVVPFKMAELVIHVRAVQERGPVNDRVFNQLSLDKYEIERDGEILGIRCECMDESTEGETICCEICGTWQHLTCYGWDYLEEKYRPKDHICYNCLLLPEEKDLNDWMPTLVACRNALNYIYTNGFPRRENESALIQAMRYKGDPADLMSSKVIQILQERKLIQGRRIVQANRHQGMEEYVVPWASIGHHYQKRGSKPGITTEQEVRFAEQHFRRYALDAIRTHDSFGDQVIRYGYYPVLATRQTRKRSASASVAAAEEEDVQGAAGEESGAGVGGVARTGRRMSRSELVCFDESSAAASEVEEDEGEEMDEDEDDLYN